ncbi:hypothetical protein BJ875DRAFT_502058 [Amylocarpus encephaloides]|uniref:NAD-dependent epimerase/dehydratase domain-containing protein n=1 Tax=Amylocarpus encephaloides TaxID=45428 RepID=A0A9P8C925_9HELO|nr:hypothetical protein BJ875DRAFT_502058 [Amylocarpus encephaloides]
MHLVLTGATGLVGSGVLHHMINASSINQVSILSRRPVPMAEGHVKVKVIIHKDFTTYPSEVLNQLKDVDGVVWAQGISQTKVNKEEYLAITHTYPLSFARALSTTVSPKPVNFIYVSGEGATTTPSFLTSRFGIIKGRTEADLLALSKDPAYSNLRPYSVRPAGVDPTAHAEIEGYAPKKTGMEGLFVRTLLPVLRFAPGWLSPTRELGGFLSKLAEGDGEAKEGEGVSGEGRTINNPAFRGMMGI